MKAYITEFSVSDYCRLSEDEINKLKITVDVLLERLNTRISKSDNHIMDHFVDQSYAQLIGFTDACVLVGVSFLINNIYE